MTADLEKLSDALKRDTPEKILEREIVKQKAAIQEAFRQGKDFILETSPRIVIKKAS